MTDLNQRIGDLAQWLLESKYVVVFTGAGISTDSGLRDFRGPDGLWTRRDKGLPTPEQNWTGVEPNSGHVAIFELQKLGKLAFLISQNVDNLHLKSGIRPELSGGTARQPDQGALRPVRVQDGQDRRRTRVPSLRR